MKMGHTRKKVMIMAGGTGGHIFPGLAVAQYLQGHDWDVVWLGNANGMEKRITQQHQIGMQAIEFSGVRGKGWSTKLLAPVRLLKAMWQSQRILRQESPDVIVGMGGYITFPAGVVAKCLGIPLILHEQNSVAGMANRYLARLADRVLLGFPGTIKKGEFTGNPLRKGFVSAIQSVTKKVSADMQVLILGGSLGAQALNEVVPLAIAKVMKEKKIHVVHQSGDKHLAELQERYERLNVVADVRAFIEDVPLAMQQADLIICRAGAMTVAEVAACGAAALFVPYPHAVDDHQTTNANFLVEQGAGWMVQQSLLTADWLATFIMQLSPDQLQAVRSKAQQLGQPNATQVVGDICRQVVEDKNKG